ncbi:MAG: EF-hand domain-containing protein [Desulfovibrionaceae bacterium]|nr:EF-hand domain-containing protein [Desulfovibrionaceae bacterium]
MFFSRITSVSLVVLLFAALVFTAASAQARPEMAGQAAAERFSAMDTNKDGKISREEFFAAYPNMKEAAFEAIDTNKDGFISLDEWEVFVKGHSKDESHAQGKEGSGDACCTPEGASGKDSGKAPDLIMPPAQR